MNDLEAYLVKLIKAQGPISMATFMAEALGHEKYGYYMKQDPFGQQGDFTTAPEISQMFGEMIGLWLGTCWLSMGRPEKIHLIELGPGRGTLMQDVLRTMKTIPGLREAVHIHLVEMSPKLRLMQAEKLDEQASPIWHDRVGDALSHAGGEPVLILANEFFDALPVRQYQKTETGWHEKFIGLSPSEKLSFALAPAPALEQAIPPAIWQAENSSIAEVCTVGEAICTEISAYIQKYSGAALIIDYGHNRHGTGDTLQAVKSHGYVDILNDPGDVDLTCHVNFQRLTEIARDHDVQIYGPTEQGAFLKSLGIEARSQSLLAIARNEQRETIISALNRLTHDDEMGRLFKVMAITNHGLESVIGFEQ